MKQQIDNLIANILLDEEAIYLPNIGTLILFRHPAKRLSSKKLQVPYREVRLKSEEKGVNIVKLISNIANVSEERAKDIYAEWLEQSQRDGATTISTVCNVANGTIFTHSSFEALVNPDGRGIKKIKPRTNHLIYILVSLGLMIALGAAAAVLLLNGTFDYNADKEQEKASAPQIENTQSIEEVATTPKAEITEDIIENTATEEITTPIEQSDVQTTEPIVEPIAEPTVPVCENLAVGPRKLQKGNSYAVWGVYDDLKNAQKYLTWLQKKFPNVNAEIYYYDARYMVALCEKSSRKECNKQVAAWRKQYKAFKDVWVYTR